MRFIFVLLFLWTLQPVDQVQVSWSYPFNDSTYRVYRCVGCSFDSIAESGNEYPEFDNITDSVITDVTLSGDVDDGIITVVPVQSCWQITMQTDYLLLKRTWFDKNCHRQYVPLVVIYGS